MTDDEVQVAGAKHKLAQAKNSKEYMAAQREIEQRREALAAREGEIAKLVEAVDAKKKLLADRASDVEALKASIAKDGDAAKARMAEIEAKIAELRVERDKLAAEVRPDVLKRYSNIRMRRGLAVVSVRNGTCQGCNMNIPPQLYNVASARPDGRDLPLLPPHHLLGGDHEGRPGAGHDAVDADPAKPLASPGGGILLALLARAGQVVAAVAFGRPSRKVRAPQGRVLANGQSR